MSRSVAVAISLNTVVWLRALMYGANCNHDDRRLKADNSENKTSTVYYTRTAAAEKPHTGMLRLDVDRTQMSNGNSVQNVNATKYTVH